MKIEVLKLLILLMFFNKSGSGFSQTHSYKHYSVEDGLPSSEVYSAFQDSKGYMWFATDAGVSRFNGYEFENFDASDGLTDNTVFLITEDHRGRIWFGTFNLMLSYYFDGIIYPYEHNDKIKSTIKEKKDLWSFRVDSNENIWMGFIGTGLYKCNVKGEIKQTVKFPKGIGVSQRLIVNDDIQVFGRLVGEKHKHRINHDRREDRFKLLNEFQLNNKNYTILVDRKVIQERNSIFYNNLFIEFYKGKYLYYASKKLYLWEIVNNELKTTMLDVPVLANKHRLYSTYVDNDFIWLCTENKGAYKCTLKDDGLMVVDQYLANISISRVFRDNNGGYWFQTTEEGVYYMPEEAIKHNVTAENMITTIEVDSTRGQLYVGFDDGRVTQVIRDKDTFHYKTLSNRESMVEDIRFNYNNSSLLEGWADSSFGYYKDGKNKKIKDASRMVVKSIFMDSNFIYTVNGDGFSIIEDGREIYYSLKEDVPRMWCTSIIKIKDKVWIGTKDGIRIYHSRKITNPYINNKYLSTAITDMVKLNDEVVLIGTKSYGLLVMKGEKITEVINDEQGLVGNLIRKIHVDNQGVIWVGTNKGISKIDYKLNDKYQIQNITKKHGLISEEVIDINSYKDTIYVATPEGLVYFDKTSIHKNITPPRIFISEFSINEHVIDLKRNSQFNHKENNISISFVGLNYRSTGEVEYQYRMLGIDSNWITTATREVRYPILPSGDYIFEVKAKNEDGIWSKVPASVSFTINPPFWFTWWFISLEVIIGLVIIIVIFRYREKQLNQKALVQKRIVELELKALRSQMNPHFIFNTMNSIQHYITENDFRNSNKYLTQFAKLIRTVLNLSEKQMITIQEELDMLRLYMDIEKMRFDEQFEYEIQVGEEIDTDYDEIPSMLIQPYVENAIWHGLMNKEEKGSIKIGIHIKDNYIRCTIEDNGIGRKRAAEIKAERKIRRKSVGMSITKERLDIINDNGDINVDILDLENAEGNPLGTKITISMPYKS